VQAGPLPDRLAPDPRVLQLVGRSPGVGVGGDVADAVAAGLDGVQVDGGEGVQDVRGLGQTDPVELDVGPRREMAVAAVEAAGDVGKPPHLHGAERAVGNGDPQHVGVQLEVEAVHEAQGLELVLRQFPGQAAAHLVPELCGAVGQDRAVDGVVAVHLASYFRRIRLTRPEDRAAP